MVLARLEVFYVPSKESVEPSELFIYFRDSGRFAFYDIIGAFGD
jgi:hypothetical protein